MLVARFEPVYLEIGEARPTEHGKRWLERRNCLQERFSGVLRDILDLARVECRRWPQIRQTLLEEGVPQAVISSGISQGHMQSLINASTKQATFTAPAVFVMALMNAAPTSTSTGALGALEATYTGYSRATVVMQAATAATPSVAQNSATISFPGCTGTGATLLGFILVDNATTGAGNALWYGTLASVVVSTTQTPPTLPAGNLNLSLTGT
jgi:hypothetical protein